MKGKHDLFHKKVQLPKFGNWNLSAFAYMLAGEVYGDAAQESTYGAAIEGWSFSIHQERDAVFEAMCANITEGLQVWVDIMSDIPSQMGWKTSEPEMDALLHHFYPGADKTETAPKGRATAQAAPPKAHDEEEFYEEEYEEDAEDDRYWEAEEDEAEAVATSQSLEEITEEEEPDLAALGIYETGVEPGKPAPRPPRPEQGSARIRAPAAEVSAVLVPAPAYQTDLPP